MLFCYMGFERLWCTVFPPAVFTLPLFKMMNSGCVIFEMIFRIKTTSEKS